MQKARIARFTESVLDDAVDYVAKGGVIVLPTDTVYGIGCAYDNETSIERIFEIKHREPTKSIAVLIADLNQVPLLTDDFTPQARSLAEKFWPGGLTLIVAKRAGLPTNLSLSPTIGVRIPDHDLTRELIRRTGPLATTSANLSGEKAACSLAEIPTDWAECVDALYDDGPVRGGLASTVVDCTGRELRILRRGALSASDLGINHA